MLREQVFETRSEGDAYYPKRWRDIRFELIGLKRKMGHMFMTSWMSKSVERRSIVHITLLKSIRGTIV